LVFGFTSLIGTGGQDGTLLYLETKLFQFGSADTELCIEKSGLSGIVELAIGDSL
jgi:hypothetical protein